MTALPHVTIYTDGGSQGNPGPGGYGAVLLYDRYRKELSGGYRLTTNNRMELMAAIVGLEALKVPCQVTLMTDSRYLTDAVNQGWARRWRANGWRRNRRDKALNPDLWARLLDVLDQHQARFQWVKGHAGNQENDRCHELSVSAAQQDQLPPDLAYEDGLSQKPPAASLFE